MTPTATTTTPVRRQYLDADESFMGLVRTLQIARAEKRAAEKLEDETKAMIKERLGGLKVAKMFGVVVLRVKPGRRTTTDEKLLKEAFPEAYEATRKVTTYDIISTN